MPPIPVRIYGDPVLRRKAAEVTEFDDALRKLVADMRETMALYNGVGLAGNQVGVLKRVLVVDVPVDDEKRARYALINAHVVERGGTETAEEGCLSIPGVYEEVTRPYRVVVEARDENGTPVRIEAEGYLARAIQHEIDHIDGVLFVDRLSALKRQFLKRSLDALARGEMPEGYASPLEAGGDG
jgi:peptide deformylase